MKMYCKFCGRQLDDAARYCLRCGSSLHKKKRRLQSKTAFKLLIWVVVGILLLFASAYLGFLWMHNSIAGAAL